MDSEYDSCELGIVDTAEDLAKQIEGIPLPADYDTSGLGYRQILASIRHEYTNYETLLYELPDCIPLWHAGKCPHANTEDSEDECPLRCLAHDILKQAGKEEAARIYTRHVEGKG
jgi:hypothetical protein